MADFAPPTGPPPPKVPAGWKAVWNEQYSEWFYVNTFTKKSQWDKPTEPVYGPGDEAPPSGAPPGYDHSSAQSAPAEKAALASNNPYGGSHDLTEDEKLARKLQAEEDARAGGSAARGESDSFYGGGGGGAYPPQGQGMYPSSPQPQQTQKKGLLGKMFGKSSSSSQQQYQQPQQGYYGGGGYPQQGYPPQQGYYGGGGYAPQPQYVQQQPPRRSGGMGVGGAAALGVGGGLLGGMLIGEAMDGGDGGGDYGGDDGGDYGGGDDGGGGGDF